MKHNQDLPLLEHLQELRRRLFVVVVALAIATIVAFAFYERIFDILLLPFHRAAGQEVNPIFTEVPEMLGVTFKVCLMVGLVGALPVLLYQIVMFVAPGLTPRERRYLLAFLPAVMLAFTAGVVFGYFVLIPPALRFMLTFGGGIAEPFIRIGSYINLMVMLLFWVGVVFETPVVMLLLARLGVVDARAFSRFRPFAVVGAFALGALITPTFDPVNQTLVALPVIVLYELGVLLARVAGRRQPRPTGSRRTATTPTRTG